MASLNTEIRKLHAAELCTLAQILNHDGSWKKLVAVVPNDDCHKEFLFNNEHISMIERESKIQKRSNAEIFLSEWNSISKRNLTCGTLLDLLVKTGLFRAADYLAIVILNINPPERPMTDHPVSTVVEVADSLVEILLNQQLEEDTSINIESNDADQLLKDLLEDTSDSSEVSADRPNSTALALIEKILTIITLGCILVILLTWILE